MEPKIIPKKEMLLAGVIGCGSSVSDLDIFGLWERFDRYSTVIQHLVEGTAYEIHIQEELDPTLHFCLVGVEISEPSVLPSEIFIKTIPAGQYAVFTHHFKDGGFSIAFQNAYDWLEKSEYHSAHQFDIQLYDDRYKGPDHTKSIIEIHIPVTK